MPNELILIVVIFVAIFVQSLVGFGSGLIAMPLLASALTLKIASPTFALVALVMELVMLARYRAEFAFGAVWRLMVTIVLGIPVGIASARWLDERIMLFCLGVVVCGYGLYGLFAPRLPHLKGRGWPFGMGFASGVLSGAYNTGGPPLIIYATSQRWLPQAFKANMQSMFLVGSVALVTGHLLGGSITGTVLRYAALALPVALVALLTGFRLERYIRPAAFRRAVLVLLVGLGLTLIF